MIRYIVVSIFSGVLFGVMDGLVNVNPLASKLYIVFRPIAKTYINVPAGVLIDLFYGFVMAWLFLALYNSLPGRGALIKGLSFGLIAWFFRTVMYVATHWMMLHIPASTLTYVLLTGLAEMLILGVFYGLTLKS